MITKINRDVMISYNDVASGRVLFTEMVTISPRRPLKSLAHVTNCSVFKERWPAIGVTVKLRWHCTNEINWKLDKFWVSVLWNLLCWSPAHGLILTFFMFCPFFDQKPLWLQQYRPQEVKYFWPKVIKSNKAAYWTKLSASVRTP